jgi:hypothetical protein
MLKEAVAKFGLGERTRQEIESLSVKPPNYYRNIK